MDKGLTKQVFLQAGIDTPAGVTIHKKSKDRSLALTGLSLPVVINHVLEVRASGYISSVQKKNMQKLWKNPFSMRMKSL